jgi:hypothetical protein
MSAKTKDPNVLRQFVDGVRRFRWMGSPLYGAFCEHIVDDDELQEIAGEAPPGQPFTHLLFAAVHALVLEDPSAPLAGYYASVTGAPRLNQNRAFAEFREFCLERRGEILAIMKRRTVQFTVAGRAGFIMPAIAFVARLTGRPLSLIDIGCSAGLLTLFDHYDYDFGDGYRVGGPAGITINSFRFDGPPPGFLTQIPEIAERVGIDLNPVDPADPAERRWIDALCPPDMILERRQLRAALDLRARTPLPVIKGDALIALPGLLAAMPDPICALATHCLYQWPQTARDALYGEIGKASQGRSLYFITIDHPAALDPSRITSAYPATTDEPPVEHEASLTVFRDGEASTTLLGRYDSFGRRGVWLAD